MTRTDEHQRAATGDRSRSGRTEVRAPVCLGLALLAAALAVTSCSAPRAASTVQSHRHRYFVSFTNFTAFHAATNAAPHETVLVSPVVEAPFLWNELVVSWNARLPSGGALVVEARALYPDRPTKFYTLGVWSEDPVRHPRHSVRRQRDLDGDVETDALVLQRPVRQAQLRLTVRGDARISPEAIRFLGVSFADSGAEAAALEPNRRAWGKTIPVPERSQRAYAGGRDWCSPTAVSMVLAHWAAVLRRAELNVDVPEVAAGVHDPQWPGTGNWPFNTAFAGRFPGLRAYVTRLSDVAELEDWATAGIPPIVSVSFDLLHGKAQDKGSGHLVVCVGFTEQGDVIANDPWADPKAGQSVRQVFPRENFVRAWRRSRQTAYLIYPESARVPNDRFGHWERRK